MSIGDEVNKLERENAALKAILDDVALIDEAIDQLKGVVQDIIIRLTEIHKGTVPEAAAKIEVIEDDASGIPIPPQQQGHQYTVTEHGGEASSSAPYKVDSKQFLGSDYVG